MKTLKHWRMALAAAVAALALGALADGLIDPTNCGGTKRTVTTDAQVVWFSAPARSVSIYNGGTTDVFAQVNITTNDFAANIASNSVTPIPAGKPCTFEPVRGVASVCLQAAAGSNGVSITSNP